jgi:hypothetical protein
MVEVSYELNLKRMKNKNQFWLSIALINLFIVSLLGVILRSKILFPLNGIDFKHVLHAHSHFAFGGWITLALISLMVYDLLPEESSKKRIYQWILWGILFSAAGMLVSFLCQGYAFFSILFSTLFILVSYAFSIVFIRDIWQSNVDQSIKILSISSLLYLSISSVGPFMLAYLMASHSQDNLMYRDSIYTYLHLQYNGFFTLAIFTLFFNAFIRFLKDNQLKKIRRFALILSVSIVPTLFISYLWHFQTIIIQTLATIGSFFIVLTLISLIDVLRSIKRCFKTVEPFVRTIALLSISAFILKSILQTGTIIPSLGKLVYGDRAIIIGYLHLVLLGFISLYLLAHFLNSGILDLTHRFTRIAITVFASAIAGNETILMVQGFGNMLMVSNSLYSWLLWIVSLWLLTGTSLILISRFKFGRPAEFHLEEEKKIKLFILNNKTKQL